MLPQFFWKIFKQLLSVSSKSFCPARESSRVFRYVDDFLMILSTNPYQTNASAVEDIFNLFSRHEKGLNFTHELPDNGTLQF